LPAQKISRGNLMLETGQKFPDFSLKNQDGEAKTLTDYHGSWLVLYVYPKDDTSGCTIQGKSFTATKNEFDKLKVKVVGLSADDVESHKSFCNKFSFTIDLLADPKATLLSDAGVTQSEYKGTLYYDRTTFVIDPKGILKKVYLNVKPDGHEQTLLHDIKAFS
jgi:peroxiredoxin Q/BCP